LLGPSINCALREREKKKKEEAENEEERLI
jgi:hypothetical protein